MEEADAMTARRGVAVIGLGNWGSSLAAALDSCGLLAERVPARGRNSHMRRHLLKMDVRVLWLCVPDAAIASTAEWIVSKRKDLHGQMVVHSSGALDRSVLAVAERAGARTTSVHPMMSFPTRRVVALKGTRFGVEAADAVTRRELFALGAADGRQTICDRWHGEGDVPHCCDVRVATDGGDAGCRCTRDV
jgi:hypothetical protein